MYCKEDKIETATKGRMNKTKNNTFRAGMTLSK